MGGLGTIARAELTEIQRPQQRGEGRGDKRMVGGRFIGRLGAGREKREVTPLSRFNPTPH